MSCLYKNQENQMQKSCLLTMSIWRFVSYKEINSLIADLKRVYRTPTEESVLTGRNSFVSDRIIDHTVFEYALDKICGYECHSQTSDHFPHIDCISFTFHNFIHSFRFTQTQNVMKIFQCQVFYIITERLLSTSFYNYSSKKTLNN